MADAYTDPGSSTQYPTPRTGVDAVAAEIRRIRRTQADDRARTLQSAAISAGGLTVKDGGSVTVRDGGDVTIQDGGDLTVAGGGDVNVRDGGNLRIVNGGGVRVDGGDVEVTQGGEVNVRAGGRLQGFHPDGSLGAKFGPMTYDADGSYSGVGLLIQGPASGGSHDVFKAKTDEVGDLVVAIGSSDEAVSRFTCRTRTTWIRAEASGSGLDAPLQISSAGEVGIYSETARLRVPWINASATANVALDADGIIQRVSSARKYKQDIEDYEPDPDAVLALRPRTWRDRGEVERDPDTTTRYPGFIAEEVHDLGLTDLVVYDADGNPDALNYDRFTAALISVLRRQQDQIDTMRAELDELRARLPEETP